MTQPIRSDLEPRVQRPAPRPARRRPLTGGSVPPPRPPSRWILGMRVDATSYRDATDAIVSAAQAWRGGMVCVATVHMVMEAFDDPGFQQLVNSADRVTADGMPLVWLLRWLGVRQAERVYGPALTGVVCRRAEQLGIPVGFYGGSPEVLDALVSSLRQRLPRLRVAFAHSPPFRPLTPEEDRRITERIRTSGARILFVGIGCPKQETWMAAHRDALPCAMVGVGAAFDFLAGAKPQAPAWMQGAGLEWLFRLLCEPRRLWRRYLIHNSRFLYQLARAAGSGSLRADPARGVS